MALTLQITQSTAKHSTAQHSTAQHSTAQHSTAKPSPAQPSPALHSSFQCDEAEQLWTGADSLRHFDGQLQEAAIPA